MHHTVHLDYIQFTRTTTDFIQNVFCEWPHGKYEISPTHPTSSLDSYLAVVKHRYGGITHRRGRVLCITQPSGDMGRLSLISHHRGGSLIHIVSQVGLSARDWGILRDFPVSMTKGFDDRIRSHTLYHKTNNPNPGRHWYSHTPLSKSDRQ